jgi:hypothetical protein
MSTFLAESTRELPISPAAFGVTAFALFSLFLYIVLRFDK